MDVGACADEQQNYHQQTLKTEYGRLVERERERGWRDDHVRASSFI